MPTPRKPRTPAEGAPGRQLGVKKPARNKMEERVAISFGPEVCNDLEAAEQREWLVTNGIGGFASGTVAGSATRRYHGLLVAALNPPAGRTFLVGALDELVGVDGKIIALAAHRWASGAMVPQGHLTIQSFRLDGLIPVWTYQAGSARIEKRIWMRRGENTTFVHYTLLECSSPVVLDLKALVNYRDFHAATHAGDWRMHVEPAEKGVCVTAFEGATPFYLRSTQAACVLQHVWYRDFFFPRENERGLDNHEDQLYAAFFHAPLEIGQTVTIVLSTEQDVDLDGDAALKDEAKRQCKILAAAQSVTNLAASEPAPAWLPRLVLAADQFIVQRPLPGQRLGKTIIAGYHWFGDWGRDTMIALPGLALATGRADIARQILLAFSRFVSGGMLPNNFPDTGGSPQYNTIDATLWYFEAVQEYFFATQDLVTLKNLFPVLAMIVDAHVKGTRYNIHVDPADGLLYGGGPGVQLTWMDAKIGDWVVTPRTGKPVEINALWINALETMSRFGRVLGRPVDDYQRLSAKAKSSFSKFWNPQRNCCFDIIDAPGGRSDPSLRPNQILAVSLNTSPLSFEQQKAVVDACAFQLLTPFGLRSLAPDDPGYTGVYSGDPRERDAAYHQGTVWGWLLGAFVLAHHRVYSDRAAALAFLEPLAKSIDSYGLGTLPEIFDGDAPHRARGCISQAWTVGELLHAWHHVQRAADGQDS
jgi:predicted glycogen debranching enzyme